MTPEFDVVVVTARGRLPILRDREDGCIERLTVVRNESVYDGRKVTWEDTFCCPDMRWVDVGHNAGWCRAANAGLSLATAPHVVLMNDDTEVKTEGWLERLRQPFLENPRIAAVGPRTTGNNPQGRLEGVRGWQYAEGVPDYDWGIGRWPLSFFCVMFSQEALLDVGLLDLRLNEGYGGDDDDWQRRAWEQGWKFAYQPEVLVEHEGCATFGLERRKVGTERNLKILREKWGRG